MSEHKIATLTIYEDTATDPGCERIELLTEEDSDGLCCAATARIPAGELDHAIAGRWFLRGAYIMDMLAQVSRLERGDA